MASSVIKRDSSIFRNTFTGNITSSNIDSITDTQILETYFASGTPYATIWGMLIVSRLSSGAVVDQCQITPKGIAVRHCENGVWSEWKKVALS